MEIETQIMIFLSKEPNKYYSLQEIHSILYDKLQSSNIIEKKNLKENLFVVIRTLSNLYDNSISVINENGILKYAFNIGNNLSEKIMYDDTCINNISDNNISNEYSITKFIIDNDIQDFISKQDFNGNTPLHIVIKNSDIERFKILLEKKVSLFLLNNNNESPIDLIRDFKISNILISRLIESNNQNQNEIKNINLKIRSMDKELSNLYSKLKFLTNIFFVFFVLTIVIIFKFYSLTITF
jgi:ankyrin repeat protein